MVDAVSNTHAQERIDRVRKAIAEADDGLVYCRFCGGIIFKVVGGYRAAKKENDWCQHMPEGERKLNES